MFSLRDLQCDDEDHATDEGHHHRMLTVAEDEAPEILSGRGCLGC